MIITENVDLQLFQDVDLIIWTGDIPGHGSWFQSKEKNLQMIRKAVEIAQECLPKVPVLPAIGNHEGYPINE